MCVAVLLHQNHSLGSQDAHENAKHVQSGVSCDQKNGLLETLLKKHCVI